MALSVDWTRCINIYAKVCKIDDNSNPRTVTTTRLIWENKVGEKVIILEGRAKEDVEENDDIEDNARFEGNIRLQR